MPVLNDGVEQELSALERLVQERAESQDSFVLDIRGYSVSFVPSIDQESGIPSIRVLLSDREELRLLGALHMTCTQAQELLAGMGNQLAAFAGEAAFPLYLIKVGDKRRFLPLPRAVEAYDQWMHALLEGLVLEQDFSLREILPEEAKRISTLANERRVST